MFVFLSNRSDQKRPRSMTTDILFFLALFQIVVRIGQKKVAFISSRQTCFLKACLNCKKSATITTRHFDNHRRSSRSEGSMIKILYKFLIILETEENERRCSYFLRGPN